ncbi:MAG: hypothetical protein WC969_10475 [Elusimicrobiota bacterium]|jgi:hypothetical protein
MKSSILVALALILTGIALMGVAEASAKAKVSLQTVDGGLISPCDNILTKC